MPVHVELATKRNNQIKIELIDNDFVDDYLIQLEKIKDAFAITQYLELPRHRRMPWDQQQISQYELRIKQAIQQLNQMGLNFPIDAEQVILTNDDQGRNLLNRLHRHFTTGHRSVSHGENQHIWQDHTDLKFRLDLTQYAQFSEHVHVINDMVHLAEKYYVSDQEINFRNKYREYHILFDPACPVDSTKNLHTEYFVPFKSTHYQYFTDNTEYDVWLPSGQIQGKNWWRAYFDCDDPTHWDISLNVNYSGSLSLGQRNQAHDPDLISWLKSHGIKPGPLHVGMPLGNIVSGKEFVADLGVKDSIVGVSIL